MSYQKRKCATFYLNGDTCPIDCTACLTRRALRMTLPKYQAQQCYEIEGEGNTMASNVTAMIGRVRGSAMRRVPGSWSTGSRTLC